MSTTDARIERVLKAVFPAIPENEIRILSQARYHEWDSLMHLNIVLSLEEEFQIALSDQDVVAINSFESATAVINSKLGQKE